MRPGWPNPKHGKDWLASMDPCRPRRRRGRLTRRTTPATGAVLGAYGPNASVRPANGPAAQPRPRTRQPRAAYSRSGSTGSRTARRTIESTTRATVPGERVAVTAINGYQRAANVTAIRYRMEVEVTGAGPGRRQATGRGCDQSCRPITTRQRPELTPEMPDERCKQPQSLNLHPQSHLNLHPPYPTSPSISTRSEHNTPPPRTENRYRGEVGERPGRKPAVFGPDGCASVTPAGPGRSPRNLPVQEGQPRRRHVCRTPQSLCSPSPVVDRIVDPRRAEPCCTSALSSPPPDAPVRPLRDQG